MLKELIDFVDSILPSVDPDFRDGVKDAITQFEQDGGEYHYLSLSCLDVLSQGDIISKLPFSFFSDTGEQELFISDAIVISTSCHIDNKDRILCAPVLPITSFHKNMDSLKRNTIFNYMYIPDSLTASSFIDFDTVNSYSKQMIMEGIEKEKIVRKASLSQLGYYVLIIKLSVYLMRREDSDTLSARDSSL